MAFNETDDTRNLETSTSGEVTQTPEVQEIEMQNRISEIRENISEKVEECKEDFKEACENVKDKVAEFAEKITNGIKDFCSGVYDNVNEWFEAEEKPNPNAEQFPEAAKFSEGITEGREFGLDKCTEAAQELFNPGVIGEWSNFSEEERRAIAMEYSDRVAEAFELENYQGLVIKDLGPGIGGQNCGDGYIYLTEDLLNPARTPLEVVDTITHELRHQYQSECINGYHDVSEEVRNEWAVATAIYTLDDPCCYDPWGYTYNPLEIDSNYAGNTVVRNMTSDMFNEYVNA